jgi:hypothetical protein
MVNPNRFYTYAYLREDRTPYYIGKGQGGRVYKKGKGEVNPPKDKSRIILLKQNLTEEKAFKHEKYMIAVFGRKDLGTGILRNKTDGGDGSSGYIHSPEAKAKQGVVNKGRIPSNKGIPLSPEMRAKISAANKGRIHSPEHREKNSAANRGKNHHFYGKSHSEETRAKQSAAAKGRTRSSESKAKQSATMKGRIPYCKDKIYITNGVVNFLILKTDIIPEGFRKGKKTSPQQWMCEETGYISTPGGLSSYQKKRGIDTSKRVRLS